MAEQVVNINGVAIAAKAQGKSIADTGTTMFRPTIRRHSDGRGRDYEGCSIRSVTRDAAAEADVGPEASRQWKRPWYFRRPATCPTRSIVKPKRFAIAPFWTPVPCVPINIEDYGRVNS